MFSTSPTKGDGTHAWFNFDTIQTALEAVHCNRHVYFYPAHALQPDKERDLTSLPGHSIISALGRGNRPFHLLPQLAQTHLLVVVLLQNLGRRQLKVLLRDVYSPLSQRIHARFRTHTLQLGP